MTRVKTARGAVLAGLVILASSWFAQSSAETLTLSLRRLVSTNPEHSQWKQETNTASWDAAATAVVICDMWDKHWCKGASSRVAEMAPRMNRVVAELRRRGVLIVHCPSETMKFYENDPGRNLAKEAPPAPVEKPLAGWCNLDSTKEPPLPIDDSDGGCDDSPQCEQGSPWRRQIATIQIQPGDAITDSTEAYNLMRQRGITNVIVMGVHQNMCVLGRPFSIRQLVYQGQNVVLMRDLTDSMYNSRRKPYVDHFTGNDLVTWHIEKYWCPTVTSDQIIGQKPFRFAADTKPPRHFEETEAANSATVRPRP